MFTYRFRELSVALEEKGKVRESLAKELRLHSEEIFNLEVERFALDSRRKGNPHWSYNVIFETNRKLRTGSNSARGLIPATREKESIEDDPLFRSVPMAAHVDVVGAGPAGLWASLHLLRRGFSVDLYEQGKTVEERFRDIRRFFGDRQFNPHSNVLFGEGGAGAFSDGKLNTRSRNAFSEKVLRDMVEFGVGEDVVTFAKPHIGTDKLVLMLRKIRAEIARLGGKIHFCTALEDIEIKDGRICAIKLRDVSGMTRFSPEAGSSQALNGDAGMSQALNGDAGMSQALNGDAGMSQALNGDAGMSRALNGDAGMSRALNGDAGMSQALNGPPALNSSTSRWQKCEALVLATGHSARDIYTLLDARGVALESKAFAMGVRVEHPQALINLRQLGKDVDTRLTGAAEYFLATPTLDKTSSAYSFCMCPGGVLVPCASEPGTLATNGMSYSRRNGKTANGAIVVPVEASDTTFGGLDFQRQTERDAFDVGGRNYQAPAQSIKAFLAHATDKELPRTTYPCGIVACNMWDWLDRKICDSLAEGFKDFDRKIPGFIEQGLMVAPETRTSSPVRISRNNETLESVNTRGLFVLGEGAGYSGGIVTSAADGVRLATRARRER